MDRELQRAIDQWLEWDQNDETKSEIQQLVADKNVDRLKQLLLHRMEFGTAGLRARMGAGFSQMNTLTIMQTVQGLLRYSQKCFSPADLRQKVRTESVLFE